MALAARRNVPANSATHWLCPSDSRPTEPLGTTGSPPPGAGRRGHGRRELPPEVGQPRRPRLDPRLLEGHRGLRCKDRAAALRGFRVLALLQGNLADMGRPSLRTHATSEVICWREGPVASHRFPRPRPGQPSGHPACLLWPEIHECVRKAHRATTPSDRTPGACWQMPPPPGVVRRGSPPGSAGAARVQARTN